MSVLTNLAFLVMLSSLLPQTISAQTKPAVELEGAIAKEQVSGDLKTAISTYKKIASESSAPRDVRARALLHLAGCYEKLGQQQSIRIYEQIIHDYGDQSAAAQAHDRLIVLWKGARTSQPEPLTMTLRKINAVETAGQSYSALDTDGIHMIYPFRGSNDLLCSDLKSHNQRIFISKNGIRGSFPSRDFSRVAMLLDTEHHDSLVLAVITSSGAGYREIAKLERFDPNYAIRLTWSWDNLYILCRITQETDSRLLKINVRNGQIRELLRLPRPKGMHYDNATLGAFFSPDGSRVAYEVLYHPDEEPVTRIFVLPAEGGESRLVYKARRIDSADEPNDWLRLLDWTVDGKYVVVATKHMGKLALSAVPVDTAATMDKSIFVKYGDFRDGWMTASGALIYRSVRSDGNWQVQLASLDSNGHPGIWRHLNLALSNRLDPHPQWLANSREVIYSATYSDIGQAESEIRLYDVTNNEDRKVYSVEGWCVAGMKAAQLFCGDRAAVVSIGLESGEVTRVHSFVAGDITLADRLSRDGRALYLSKRGQDGWKLVRLEIATGVETVIADSLEDGKGWSISPDEQWILRYGWRDIKIRSTSGGDWKELPSVSSQWGSIGAAAVSPDSRWLFYHPGWNKSLFRVSINGGTSERIADFPAYGLGGSMQISPNGQSMIVSSYSPHYEFWRLENFVPAVKGK